MTGKFEELKGSAARTQNARDVAIARQTKEATAQFKKLLERHNRYVNYDKRVRAILSAFQITLGWESGYIASSVKIFTSTPSKEDLELEGNEANWELYNEGDPNVPRAATINSKRFAVDITDWRSRGGSSDMFIVQYGESYPLSTEPVEYVWPADHGRYNEFGGENTNVDTDSELIRLLHTVYKNVEHSLFNYK